MSYPTRDLMLFEELNADKIAIIDAYGMNVNLFSSEQGTTFTNVRDSVRMVYTDTIIPETQQMYDTIAHQMGLDKQGISIVADFSHLPVLQDDEPNSMTIEKAETIAQVAQVLECAISTADRRCAQSLRRLQDNLGGVSPWQ